MERNFVIATRKPNGEFNEAKAYGDNEHLEDLIINPLVEAFKRYQQICREREKANGTGKNVKITISKKEEHNEV